MCPAPTRAGSGAAARDVAPDHEPQCGLYGARFFGDPSALPSLRVVLADHEVTQVNAPTTLAAEAQKAIDAIEGRTN